MHYVPVHVRVLHFATTVGPEVIVLFIVVTHSVIVIPILFLFLLLFLFFSELDRHIGIFA
jgi:hypothetical protein